MSFKEYIQNLSKKQTFQLYTIIAIFILYPYIQILDLNSKENHENKNILQLKANIIKMDQKLKKPNLNEVLKDFEKEAKSYSSLKINNFKLDKRSISINGDSKQEDLLKYILYCENYNFTSTLESLSIKPTKVKNLYTFSFDIKFKNHYSKKISNKELLKEYKNIATLTNSTNKTFILQGILDDFIILDNHLLSKGDSYGSYKVEKINKDHVVISDSNIKKVLYLKKDNDAK